MQRIVAYEVFGVPYEYANIEYRTCIQLDIRAKDQQQNRMTGRHSMANWPLWFRAVMTSSCML